MPKFIVSFFCFFLINQNLLAASYTNSIAMELVEIPAGSFLMGLADPWDVVEEMDEPDPERFNDEMPQHKVEISQSFYLATTEVTQEQWFEVMGTRPGPEENWQGENWKNLPVIAVSWFMAQKFIDKLNTHDEQMNYRLPTEAEWEYAARAGNNDLRPVALSELENYAWFIHNSDDHAHPVATKSPNAWGLYDMLGNVWEWVDDYYSASTYAQQARLDPQGPESGKSKVRRGGSYHCPLFQVRPAYRAANPPKKRFAVFGFRVAADKS